MKRLKKENSAMKGKILVDKIYIEEKTTLGENVKKYMYIYHCDIY